MITHRPACDWLTFTTYDQQTERDLNALVLRHFPNAKDESRVEKQGRYDGRGGAGWFGGETSQDGKRHILVRFSGDLADSVMFDQLKPGGVDCTRIDLQITMPLQCEIGEAFEHYIDLLRVLKSHEEEKGQRARKVKSWPLDPDGLSTIYVGTREGTQRFYRIYVKEGPEGDYYIRFEVEFKDKSGLAGRVFRSINNDPLTIVSLLAGELSTLPPHKLLDPLHEQMAMVPVELMKQERRRAEKHKTMEWLKRQVAPSIRRMIGYHDTRDDMEALLMDWLSFAARLKELDHE